MIHVQFLTGAFFSVLISLKGYFYARIIDLSKGQATLSRSQAGTTDWKPARLYLLVLSCPTTRVHIAL